MRDEEKKDGASKPALNSSENALDGAMDAWICLRVYNLEKEIPHCNSECI